MEEYPKSFNCLSKHDRKEFVKFILNFRVDYKDILEKFKFNFEKIL